MNRVELLKKERSILWLREVKQWMDQGPENMNDALNSRLKNITSQRHSGECSRYMSDSVQISVDENSANYLGSDSSFAAISLPLLANQHADLINCVKSGGELKQGKLQPYPQEGSNSSFEHFNHSHSESLAVGKHQTAGNPKGSHLTAFDDIVESHSSSAYPGSPPHYKEDILHRRNNLVEEILQLSADSYSVVSSDSNTSCSDDELCEYGSLSHMNSSLSQEFPFSSVDMQIVGDTDPERCHDLKCPLEHEGRNGQSVDSLGEQTSNILEHFWLLNSDESAHDHAPDVSHLANQHTGSFGKRRNKRKAVKRVVALPYENDIIGNSGISGKSSVNMDYDGPGDGLGDRISNGAAPQEVDAAVSGGHCSFNQNDEFIANYFQQTVVESGSPETCRQYVRCDCVLEQESIYRER